jgi:hypothetical protein
MIMTMEHLPLWLELRAWRKAGHRPRLWWRDDGARMATPALQRLLALSWQAGVPVSLAVDPWCDRMSLSDCLNPAALASVLQLGGGFGNESLDPDCRIETLARKLQASAQVYDAFVGYLPVYVVPADVPDAPSWVQIPANLTSAAVLSGLVGLSGFGMLSALIGVPRIDAHVRLAGGENGGTLGRRQLAARVAHALRHRRLRTLWDEPLGLLTHHPAHDRQIWDSLAWLLMRSPLSDEADWLSAAELFRPSRREIAQPARLRQQLT